MWYNVFESEENIMLSYNPNTIYKDLIKLVHPDLHPSDKQATAKTQLVTVSKNNPAALRTFAIRWGFIIPSEAEKMAILAEEERLRRTNRPIQPPPRPQPTTRPSIFFHQNDGVIIKQGKYYRQPGVIVEISTIKKGKYYGFESYTVYLYLMDIFVTWKVRTYNNTSEWFEKKDTLLTNVELAKRKWKERNIWINGQFSTLSELGLTANSNYGRLNINITVRIHGINYTLKLLRTTAKCVVVDFFGVEKVVRLNSVVSR